MSKISQWFASMCLLFFCSTIEAKVVLSQIMYDSPFNEEINKPPYSNGEFIELYNLGTTDVSMDGWLLTGGGSTERWFFPDGVLLPAGESLLVVYRHIHSESTFSIDSLLPTSYFQNSEIVLYQRKIVLSNSGETLSLYNADGHLEDSWRYLSRSQTTNSESIPLTECRSWHRIRVSIGVNGEVISNNSDWEAGVVSYGCDKPFAIVSTTALIQQTQQSQQGENYRLTITPLESTTPIGRTRVSCTIYDGLGRSVKSISCSASPEANDIATLVEYDALNQVKKSWLPVPMSGGEHYSDEDIKTAAGLLYESSYPFVSSVREPLLSSRQILTIQPGESYHEHPTIIKNETNATNEVIRWRYSDEGISMNGYYLPGSLIKTRTTSGDGRIVEEYKDMHERVILQSQGNASEKISTYFVYDDYSRLAYVLPPMALQKLNPNCIYNIDSLTIHQYAYVYKYDAFDHLILKKLPGASEVLLVCDKEGKLILSQDGNQRQRGNFWRYIAYDLTGRNLYEAEVEINDISHEDLILHYSMTDSREERLFSMTETGLVYSCSVPGCSMIKPLREYYYDDYNYLSLFSQEVRDSLSYNEDSRSGSRFNRSFRVCTGMRVFDLKDTNYSLYAYYYDIAGNLVQTRSLNSWGEFYAMYCRYNHDKTLASSTTSNAGNIETTTYTYDHVGRPINVTYQLNESPEMILSRMSYDKLGRLARKLLHNGQLQHSIRYDMRNAVTHLTSGLFSETIYYADSLPQNANAQYDGNISAIEMEYSDNRQLYLYAYDELSRLTGMGEADEEFNVIPIEQMNYDKQGNIQHLSRYISGTQIDDLYYDYDGNQVIAISDLSERQNMHKTKEYTDYSSADTTMRYDANGNLIVDLDRRISKIVYNLLNLPDTIFFSNGNMIVHDYNAVGEKLKSVFVTNMLANTIPVLYSQDEVSTYGMISRRMVRYNHNIETVFIEHRDSLQTAWTQTESRIYNSEGYTLVQYGDSDIHYCNHYYCQDYLGNNVAVWDAETRQYVQQTHYYASGLPMNNSSGADVQQHKYGGKEYLGDYGLDEYDSEARWYYPAIMRTTTMDPLAEKYYSISPYAWCGNNPMVLVDPDGKYCIGSNLITAKLSLMEARWAIAQWKTKLRNIDNPEIESVEKTIAQFERSISDFECMLNDPDTEYQFIYNHDSTPYTTCIGINDVGDKVVEMNYSSKDTKFAEARHGGQLARHEMLYGYISRPNPYDDQIQVLIGYGIHSEVDQYCAQLAWLREQNFKCIPVTINQGITKFVYISDYSQITSELIRSIVEFNVFLYKDLPE